MSDTSEKTTIEPGDWVLVSTGPDAFIPMHEVVAKVHSVYNDGRSLSIIAGSLATSVNADDGDQWRPTAEPVLGARDAFIAGQPLGDGTPPPWDEHDRRHRPGLDAIVDVQCWLAVEGLNDAALALIDVTMEIGMDEDPTSLTVEEIRGRAVEFASAYHTDVLDGVSDTHIDEAIALGILCADADGMCRGPLVHHFGQEFEVHAQRADDLRALCMLIDGYEALGATITPSHGAPAGLDLSRA